VVTAIGSKFTDGFVVVGSSTNPNSDLHYFAYNSNWAATTTDVAGFTQPSTPITGPHVLASGGVLFPAPVYGNGCQKFSSTASQGYPGPTGVFFAAQGGQANVNFQMFTTSRTWRSFRTMMGFNEQSYISAFASWGAGAVTTIFPALTIDNYYMSPYSISTNYPLSDLTFDFSSSPARQDITLWTTPSYTWHTDANGNLATPLSTAQGIWNPDFAAVAQQLTVQGGLPPFAQCDLTYGPSLTPFPPVARDPLGAWTQPTWRRERQVATAYSFTYMGLAYMHTITPAFTPLNAPSGIFDYVSRGRWMPGMDCSCFSSFHTDFAHGLMITSAVYQQGLAAVGYYFNGTAGATNPSIPVANTAPNNVFAYGAVVASQPISYDNLISLLKPGDFLYIAGGGPALGPSHVIMWLGNTALNGGVGQANNASFPGLPLYEPYPLILDSTDTQFSPDAFGFLAPTGPHIRAFRPNEWYFQVR
jgi:hypothetical protein